MLIGISPELEMALYTLCLRTRKNMLCYVSLDGNRFPIMTVKDGGKTRTVHFRLLDHLDL